ncbi:MAG: hypothetical protein CMJ40_09275 [Phycisphaerae bacterium]|nr:hypothetical protein [Phycisphaerae bacterium]
MAGAAGYRIQEAWASIDKAYRMMVIHKLERSAKADMEAEDLWSEAVARMMREDPETGHNDADEPVMHIARYRGMTRLPWYFLATARTIAIDRHRRRERGPRQQSTDFSEDVSRISQMDDPSFASTQSETMKALAAAVLSGFESLEANHQYLLAAIYRDGMSKAEAGAIAGLSPWQTSRELRKAEEHMRLRVQHALPGEWNALTKDAWIHGWQQCWRVSDAPTEPDRNSRSEDVA